MYTLYTGVQMKYLEITVAYHASLIHASMIALIFVVVFEGLPEPNFLEINPVVLNFAIT